MIYFSLPYIFGVLSSWHGGQITVPYDVKVVKNIAWCIPQFAVALVFLPWWITPLVFIGVLKAIGHGRIWNPRTPLATFEEPEAVERWGLKFLIGKVSDFWYKVIAMSATGLAAVSGAVLAFAYFEPLAAAAIALGGAAKGLNAIVFTGHKEDGKIYNSTEAREVADGVAVGTGFLLACWIMGA